MTDFEAHVDEGTLVRLIDDESSAEERSDVEAHLAVCAQCAQSLVDLTALASRVSTTLDTQLGLPGRVPPFSQRLPGTRRRAPARGLLAAAVIVLAVGAVFAVPASRAFAREWIARLAPQRRDVAPPAVRELSHDERSAREPEERVLVEFNSESRELTIEFRAGQQVGTLTIASHDAATIVLRSATPSAVTVLPAVLRVDNALAPTGYYRLLVPGTIDRLVIQLPDRRLTVLSRVDLADSVRTVQLR